MFIFNMKMDGNRTSKIFMGALCIILVLLTCFICYSILFKSSFKTNDDMIKIQNQVFEITAQNYTNVLKNVHENLDKYIGQKIKFSGFVYRLYDFSNEQFVLARNMIISSDYQTVVVGFLCHSSISQNYVDGTWLEIQGTITKGNYNGEIPVIEVESINQINTPNDEYVYPPDSSFITTSTVL